MTSQLLLSEACMALGEHLASLLSSTSSSNSNKLPKESSTFEAEPADSTLLVPSSLSLSPASNQLTLRRQALNAFADAASYAAKAQSYDLVVHAARYYWNLTIAYWREARERATLFDTLKEVLNAWQAVFKLRPAPSSQDDSIDKYEKDVISDEIKAQAIKSKKSPSKSKQSQSTAQLEADAEIVKKSATNTVNSQHAKSPPSKSKSPRSKNKTASSIAENNNELATATKDPRVEDAFDDLTLLCALYACYFQILIDRDEHDAALAQMDRALADMPVPRASRQHRLLIHRLKVITKARLGLDVQMDVQKFRDETEKNLAQMYRKVALTSIRHADTIRSYQRAIEALHSDESVWLKFEYIVELAEWLYSHELSDLTTCVDLVEWAIDLVMSNASSLAMRPLLVGGTESTRVRSRATSTTTVLSRANHPQSMTSSSSKRLTTKLAQMSSNVMLPTIMDESQVTMTSEPVLMSESNMIDTNKNASQDEMDMLMKKSNRENLFADVSNTMRPNSWNDLFDLKQLDCLIRAHTVLAQMNGRGAADAHIGYALKAYYCVVRLIQVGVENASLAAKEIAKSNAANDTENNKKKQQATESAKKSNLGDTRSSLGTKKTTLVQLPQTVEQWSHFELSEDIFAAWTHDLMRKTGINGHTIGEPYLLYRTLKALDRVLADLGLDHFRFAVAHAQLILLRTCLRFDRRGPYASLHIYVRFKLINLCTQMNLIGAIAAHQQALASLVETKTQQPQQETPSTNTSGSNPLILLKLLQIDANDACFVRDRIYQHQIRLVNAENEEAAALINYSSSSFVNNQDIGIKPRLSIDNNQAAQKKHAKIMPTDDVGDLKLEATAKIRPHNALVNEIRLPGEKPKLDDNLADALYKDVWLGMAELLIDNGFFHTARDYLVECLNASQRFDDKITMAKVHHLLAKFSLFESNFIETRQYASNALKTPIDELFWYKNVRLMSESHKLDVNDKDGYDKALRILKRALNKVRLITPGSQQSQQQQRMNKSDTLAYIEAMLIFDIAEIIRDGLLSGRLSDNDDDDHEGNSSHKMRRKLVVSKRRGSASFSLLHRLNSMHPDLFKRLSDVCNMYQASTELLIRHGYKRESIEVIRSHARLLKTFANDCHNEEAKHDYLIQAYTVLNDGSTLLSEVYTEIMQLNSWSETHSVSPPIQREFIDMKLELCQLLTDMLELELERVVYKNECDLIKDSAVKAIENYVEPLNEIESEWSSLLLKLPDLLLTNLTSMHLISNKVKRLKLQCYYLIGRTYRLTSEMAIQLRTTNEDDRPRLDIHTSLSRWNDRLVDLYRSTLATTSGDVDSSIVQPAGGSKARSKAAMKSASNVVVASVTGVESVLGDTAVSIVGAYSTFDRIDNPMITHVKSLIETTNQFDSQALECLMQAQNLAFALDDKHLSCGIALEMIELVARYDMNLCAQLIAFYQSCLASIEAEKVVVKSSTDPKNSLLTGCLNQIKFYADRNVKHNCLSSPTVRQLLDVTKSKLNAFKYLDVNAGHFNIGKDLPMNYIFLIIQHNLQKTEIYCSVLDRSKIVPQGGSKPSKIPNSQGSISKSMVAKFKTDPFELYHLKQLWSDWKADLKSFNLKLDFQLSNSLGKDMVSTRNDTAFFDKHYEFLKYYISQNNPKYGEMLALWSNLEEKFDYLLQRTETYLRRTSEFVQNYFNMRDLSYQHRQSSMSVKQSQSRQVLTKPNERLIILADLDLMEFPLELLQMFHENKSILSLSRDFSLHFFATRFSSQKEVDSKTEDSKKISKPNLNKQQQSLEPLPEHSIVIDQTKLKYMIDLYNEFTPGVPDELTPSGCFKQISQKYSQLSSKWTGLLGSEHVSSVGERESLFSNSHCLVFSGCERFLSYFNSRRIASSDLNDCRFLLANDLAQTTKSYIRAGKEDDLKIPSELESEHTVESSLLLTLAGLKSIALNQWSSTLADNMQRLQSLLVDLIESRQSGAETIRLRRSPGVRAYVVAVAAAADEEQQRVATAASEKNRVGNKKDTTAVKKESTASKALKSPGREKSPKSKKQLVGETIDENAEFVSEQVDRIMDSDLPDKQSQSRISIHDSNMIFFGLPDIYLVN